MSNVGDTWARIHRPIYVRSHDVWGNVRLGAQTGEPKGRYVANLGHVQDDESGLIYMRARYYEPTSGKFIWEDPAKDGTNWFAYCENNPVAKADSSGESSELVGFLLSSLQRLIQNVIEGRMTQEEALSSIRNVIQRDLRRFARVNRLIGLTEIEEGVVLTETSVMHGSLAGLSKKLGELRQACGAKRLAFSAVAEIGIHLAENAYFLIEALN